MSDHARLSPSNLRWPHCPGSVREEAQYPDVAGEAAIDGTGSHLLLELCLKEGNSPEEFQGQVIGYGDDEKPMGWLVEEDRIERVQMAISYIDRRVKELESQFPGATITVESESQSNPGALVGRDDWYGTADVTILVMVGDEVVFGEVIDYKDGRGFVGATNNTQLLSYAIGKILTLPGPDARGVRMTIVQPKTKPPVRYTDSLTGEDLLKQQSVLAAAAAATDDLDAPCVAGPWCQWCRASVKRGGHCSLPLQQLQEVPMGTEITELSGLDIVNEDSAKLGKLLTNKKGITDIFDAIEQELYKRAKQGLDVPGWAIGHGRPTRQWADEEKAAKYLKTGRKMDDYMPRKLISPAQAEKLVGKKKFDRKAEELVITVDGKEKLVPAKETPKVEKDIFAAVPSPPSFL